MTRRPPTLAQRTWLSAWTSGESTEAECDLPGCDWAAGPGSHRTVLYQARRHVADDGHSPVTLWRTLSREVHPADLGAAQATERKEAAP